MSKILNSKIKCACCGKQVNIERVFSFSYDSVGLSGNKHTSMQYKLEECPECHYTALDIGDCSVKVSRAMLSAFRVKKEISNITDLRFVSILKAAHVYEKNKMYHWHAYCLRLASFLAEELQETSISRMFLKQANEALEMYFETIEEMGSSDIMLAINLVDGNRRLGMMTMAKNMCNEILALIDEAGAEELNHMRRLLEFEHTLLENRDIGEHLISEVL